MYNLQIENQSDSLIFHYLDINEIDEEFQNLIISSITEICGGRYTQYSLDFFKRRLYNFLNGKNDEGKKGAIAEFIIHIHLNYLSFSQEFLFLNLEERSVKKGFDGYYLLNGEHWIVESKSSGIVNEKHESKILEAYNDLKSKLETKIPNNPWNNAYNHMRHQDVNTNQSIVSVVRQYSEEFENEMFQDIKKFNVIPCSTLYLGNDWNPINKEDLEIKLQTLCQRFGYRKMIIICINSKSFQDFINLILV